MVQEVLQYPENQGLNFTNLRLHHSEEFQDQMQWRKTQRIKYSVITAKD